MQDVGTAGEARAAVTAVSTVVLLVRFHRDVTPVLRATAGRAGVVRGRREGDPAGGRAGRAGPAHEVSRRTTTAVRSSARGRVCRGGEDPVGHLVGGLRGRDELLGGAQRLERLREGVQDAVADHDQGVAGLEPRLVAGPDAAGLRAERQVSRRQLSDARARADRCRARPCPASTYSRWPCWGRSRAVNIVAKVPESSKSSCRPWAVRRTDSIRVLCARRDPHRRAQPGRDHAGGESLAHHVGDGDLQHGVVEEVPVVVVAADVERRLAAAGDVVAEHVRRLLGEQPALDLLGLDRVGVGGELGLDPAGEVVEERGSPWLRARGCWSIRHSAPTTWPPGPASGQAA